MEFSNNQQTKYYALQILESVIKTRWKILPRNQCEGIKKYIVGLIIKTSSDPEVLEKEKTYLNKLNMILVQVGATFYTEYLPFQIMDSSEYRHIFIIIQIIVRYRHVNAYNMCIHYTKHQWYTVKFNSLFPNSLQSCPLSFSNNFDLNTRRILVRLLNFVALTEIWSSIQYSFFMWSPLVRRHLSDHLLWSIFQSSLHILHIINHVGPFVWAATHNEAFTIIILYLH